MLEITQMQQMPAISIIADATTGKVIQKYLNRESISVESNISDLRSGTEPVSLCIIDVAGMREHIVPIVTRLNSSTGCTRYILITSMDNPSLAGELSVLNQHWTVDTIAKPIKLSELKSLVERQAAENRTAVGVS
jgi:hypothetical protein